jgi:diacylglycerol kinase family enzyme
MAGAFTGRHLRHPQVSHRAAVQVAVDSDYPLALHADGEWLGRWPSVRFEVVPHALHILVPPWDRIADGRTS